MQKKKIIWFLKGLGMGGTENLLAMSVPYLNRNEFSYEIVYLENWNDAMEKRFIAGGIPVTCLRQGNPMDLRIIPRLVTFLKEKQPDIFEVHLPYPGMIGRIAAKLARIKPILYVEHSLAVQINLERMHIVSFMGNMLTYPMNDYVVAVSRDTKRDIRRYSLVKKPVEVVYNGVDLGKIADRGTNVAKVRQVLGVPEGYKVVGHVANLLPKKRQDILLKAARKVIDAYPDVVFIIVGRGPQDTRLKQLARLLEIQDKVIFAGFVDDLYEVMRTFDVFTMSSDYEGFCISLAEAMALGKPAVVTRVGGMPEVVEDNVSGFLANHRSPEDLADQILKLLRDDELRTKMGEAARTRAILRFDIRKRVAAMENIYRKLAGENRNNKKLTKM